MKRALIISSITVILAVSLFFMASNYSDAEISTASASTKLYAGKIKDAGEIPSVKISATNITNLLKELDKKYKNDYSWKDCTIDKMKQHENITLIYVYCDFPTSKLNKTKLSKDNQCQPLYMDNNVERCNISMKWLMNDADYYKIAK